MTKCFSLIKAQAFTLVLHPATVMMRICVYRIQKSYFLANFGKPLDASFLQNLRRASTKSLRLPGYSHVKWIETSSIDRNYHHDKTSDNTCEFCNSCVHDYKRVPHKKSINTRPCTRAILTNQSLS